ncbi:MAG: aldo/keto reductase [Actinomycetota bacterium]|nr:aldo/keto reductase [Actinomycetota bacterium]
MDYVSLGATGLQVSRICLGCMSYGEPGQGAHPWSLDREASEPFFRQALDAGINFFDTANVYSAGSSEEIIDEFGRSLYREEDRSIVEAVLGVATKRGVAPARVALAWLLGKPGVDAPIVGATKVHHLDDAVAAVDLRLDDSEVDTLEKGYQPRPVVGFN